MLIAVLSFLIEAIKYIFGYYVCYSKKVVRVWPFIAGGITFCVVLIIFDINRTESNVFATIFTVFLLLFCIDVKGYRRFLYILFLFFIMTCFDEIINFTFIESYRLITNMEIMREYEYLLNIFLSAIIIISFSFIKTIFIKTYSIKINEPIRKIVNILIIVIGIIILVTATGFQFLSRSLEDSKHIIFASIMCLVSYIGIGGLGLFFAYTNKLNGELEKQVETEQHFNIMQEKYYQTLLEKETDTKMYRHDLINHLICLSEISDEKNIDKIQDYIRNLQKNIVNIQNKAFFTGCNVLDIFINYYAQVLEANITVDVKGKCTCNLAISDVDMCVIFSNLLQNAVEHLNQQNREGKYLKIDIKEGDVFFQVQIINSLNERIGNTKEFVTTKKDKANHGYGLQNIKEAINRNDGSFNIEFNDHECIANVVLKISNNQVI